MRKIKIPSDLTSLAYQSIKQSILEGRIDQDCRLTESMLSTQLGISRSPIREALNSLATEGLITIKARRGASLRQFTVKEINDLYDLRKVLEIFAVSTVTITPQLLETLEKSIQRAKSLLRSNKKQEFIEEDMHFHETIAKGTGNKPLALTLANVQNQIWLCRCKTYNLSSTRAPQDHQSIVDALKHGDRALAKKAMGDQIDYVRQQLINSIQEQPVSELRRSDPGQRARLSPFDGNHS